MNTNPSYRLGDFLSILFKCKLIGPAKLLPVTVPLLVILLAVGPPPASAGVLDTINENVKTVKTRTGTIVSNTNGVQDLVTNVRGITSGFRNGVVSDLQESLGEAQDLMAFIKERRENAGDPGDYPDLVILIESLESLMRTLQNNPNGGDLGALSRLLQVLPDRLLAVAAQAVSKAGVDGTFVNRINQMALDLALLTEAIRQDEADRAVELQTLRVNLAAPQPGVDDLPSPTRCDWWNDRRLSLKRAATISFSHGLELRLVGEILSGLADTIQTEKKIGIHGYAGLAIKTDSSGAIGDVMAGIGTAIMDMSDYVFGRLRHCEILFNQAEIKVQNELLMDSNQDVLDSNAILLEEICGLTRYRSANCQALLQ